MEVSRKVKLTAKKNLSFESYCCKEQNWMWNLILCLNVKRCEIRNKSDFRFLNKIGIWNNDSIFRKYNIECEIKHFFEWNLIKIETAWNTIKSKLTKTQAKFSS